MTFWASTDARNVETGCQRDRGDVVKVINATNKWGEHFVSLDFMIKCGKQKSAVDWCERHHRVQM